MQTSASPLVPSGATQQPLLRADQIVPGVIITGTAWHTVREVVEIDRDVAVLQHFPRRPLALQNGHLHALNQNNNTECLCGYRREPFTGLLPVRDGMVRTYVIAPSGPLVLPDPHTVYIGPGGVELRWMQDRGWIVAQGASGGMIPVIPRLYAAWTIPEALRGMVWGQ